MNFSMGTARLPHVYILWKQPAFDVNSKVLAFIFNSPCPKDRYAGSISMRLTAREGKSFMGSRWADREKRKLSCISLFCARVPAKPPRIIPFGNDTSNSKFCLFSIYLAKWFGVMGSKVKRRSDLIGLLPNSSVMRVLVPTAAWKSVWEGSTLEWANRLNRIAYFCSLEESSSSSTMMKDLRALLLSCEEKLLWWTKVGYIFWSKDWEMAKFMLCLWRLDGRMFTEWLFYSVRDRVLAMVSLRSFTFPLRYRF